ncbi:MAG: serine/threonine-protein phosphatase [Balneolaceae bacterium]|nr:serine/threonine-protein phosphatase [Balneolaceae bacterium]
MLVESRDSAFIINNLLLILMGRLLVTKAAIFIHDPVKETYCLKKRKGFDKFQEGSHYNFELNSEQVNQSYFELTGNSNLIPSADADLNNCYLFNLRTSNNHHGYLLLGPKANNRKFNPEDLEFAESLCIISTAALVNSQLFTELTTTYRNLDRRIHELNTLFDLSKEFNLLVDRDKISSIFKFALLGQLFIRTFFLIYKTGDSYSLLASSGAVTKPSQKQIDRIFSEADEDIIVVDDDLRNRHDWINKSHITTLFSVTIQNERVALIGVGERVNKIPFSDADYNFLKSLANLAVISIQKTFFLEERIDKERMEEELSIAKAIQEGLLPDPIPEIAGVDLAAKTISSREVGGDYFDIAEAPDGNTIFAIADVTGKGVPAALLMANLQSMLHVLLPVEITLSEATDRINNIIHKNTPSDKFITFFWAKYINDHKILRYVNAGHNPPLLLRFGEDEFIELTDGGLLLGAMETMMPYVQTDIQLNSGDLLVCYTDGIDETMNAGDEEYGTKRLKDCIVSNRDKSSQEILDAIVNSVKEYSGNKFSDDLTLLVLKACD